MSKYVIKFIATILSLLLMFLILLIPNTASAYEIYTFTGGGKGHGVGMCMTGVLAQARAGRSYRQILPYYYRNVSFGTRNDFAKIWAKCQKHGHWHKTAVKEYLYRLAEEPNSWPTEGLRSLMVAARTYLWYKIDRYGKITGGQNYVCDLNPNSDSRSNIVRAVKDTQNKILTYNNKPIVAAYSAHNGGWEADFTSVWGGSGYPYLKGRSDSWCKNYSGHRWGPVSFSRAKLQSIFSSHGVNIGTLTKIDFLGRGGDDYRPTKVRLTGTGGTRTIWAFSQFASWLGLKSSLMWVKKTNSTKLSINGSSKTVRTGQWLTIYGQIIPNGSGTMSLNYKRGNSRWGTAARARVNGSTYRIRVRPTTRNRYTFSVRLGSARSRVMHIYTVGKKLSINANAKIVRRGQWLTIYGRIIPNGKGTLLLRYKRSNSRWATAVKTRVNGSTYRIKVKPTTANRYTFSVRLGSAHSRVMTIFSR